MSDIVDLTLSDDEEQTYVRLPTPPPAPIQQEQDAAAGNEAAQQDDEAAQRKRIMDFAKNVAASKRARNGDGAGPSSAAAGGGPAAAAGTDAPGTPAAGAGTSAAAAAGGGGGGGVSNADLKALHEARMRRMQQQQGATAGADSDQQQQPGGSCAAAAAAAGGEPGKQASSSPQKPRLPAERQQAAAAAAPAAPGTTGTTGTASSTAAAAGSSGSGGSKAISLLSYNVWFREDVAVVDRMMGIGDIVKEAGLPTFICLQEVTPFILDLVSQMEWWGAYTASPIPHDAPYFTLLLVKKAAAPGVSSSSFTDRHFANSMMGRSLRSVSTSVGGSSIVVATSHLESPCPPRNFYSQERQQQMAESLWTLDAAAAGNVLFAGDMNWDEKRDGAPQLPIGWEDAWLKLQGTRAGMTYDTSNNPMLPWKGLRVRLDRIFCKLRDWRLSSVRMVGTQPLPGVTYTHTFKNGGRKELPVLPSDHFGLLLQLEEV